MSTERFEQDLAEIPRAGLPASLREEILEKACVAAPEPPLLTKWWNSTPKPLAAAVAAAWVAIVALKITTPSAEPIEPRPILAAETTPVHFIAWVERHRTVLQNL